MRFAPLVRAHQVRLGVRSPRPLHDDIRHPSRHRRAGKNSSGAVRVYERVEGVRRVYSGARAGNSPVRLGERQQSQEVPRSW